ncbi:MAG: glycosyltransferase family 4 protein [Bacteriovoracaceae bacterium]
MKIGFDAKRAFCNHRGLGYYSRTLITSLVEKSKDSEFYLFTPKVHRDFENFYKDHSLVKRVLPEKAVSRMLPSLWRSFGIGKASKDLKLDVFHGLSHEVPYGIKNYARKVVVTIHDLMFDIFPEHFKPIDRITYRKKIAHAIKEADLILTICENTKADLMRVFPETYKPIKVLYQAIDDEYFQEVSLESEVQKLDINYPFILGVGALVENKNHESLIKSFSKIKKEKPNLHLIIVGKGSEAQKESLRNLAKELKVFDSFHLYTDLKTKHLHYLYKQAELFIFPSLYEGFGLPIVEAMASGCPVITSMGSGHEEAAGGAAKIVNPKDCDEIANSALEILSSEEKKRQYINLGLIQAQKFRSEKVSAELLDIYEGLFS